VADTDGVIGVDGSAGADPELTAVILAGGRGSRMGGLDKGLQLLGGKPLALHALERVRPQVGRVFFSANRHLDAYAAFGVPVWPDDPEFGEFAGPLAGFRCGLAHCDSPYLLTVPCDTPLFPLDLAARLKAACQAGGADLAQASAPNEHGAPRLHSAFCLLRSHLAPSLHAFMQGGGRKISAWAAQQQRVQVQFDLPGDNTHAFFNANSADDLHRLQASNFAPHPP
jgi:molybdenum cofactor guanylyltransferase